MNILMILSNSFTHDPRVYNEAMSLIKAGHNVTVLAWDKKRKDPLTEIKDGIKVIRSYNSKFMDLLPYDIFRMHFWWRKGYKDTLKLFNKNHFDAVHCHDLDTLPIGIRLKKKFGIPLIYDAHEIWGYMVSEDLPKIWANYYLWIEKNNLKYVNKIIVVNEPLKNYFNSLTKKQVSTILNCKHLQKRKYESANNDIFTLLYIGALAKDRFLLEILDIIENLSRVKFIIGGKGHDMTYVKSLKHRCLKIQNADFIGAVPFSEVLSITKKSDAVVCMFDPKNKNNQVGLPNKIFEAMVCGRPIICTKNIYSGFFIEREECGLTSKYAIKNVKKTIIKLRDNPKIREEFGKNALNAALKEYNWYMQEEKLKKLYEDLKDENHFNSGC